MEWLTPGMLTIHKMGIIGLKCPKRMMAFLAFNKSTLVVQILIFGKIKIASNGPNESQKLSY